MASVGKWPPGVGSIRRLRNIGLLFAEKINQRDFDIQRHATADKISKTAQKYPSFLDFRKRNETPLTGETYEICYWPHRRPSCDIKCMV
jgi:hypothetical protein